MPSGFLKKKYIYIYTHTHIYIYIYRDVNKFSGLFCRVLHSKERANLGSTLRALDLESRMGYCCSAVAT